MTNKRDKYSKILFQRLGLIAVFSIVLLAFNNYNKNSDIENNSTENTALVTYINYISFIDNAKSQKRISYYQLDFQYRYSGEIFNKSIQLQPYDYKTKIGRKLNKGDEITIFHSFRNPKNVAIK